MSQQTHYQMVSEFNRVLGPGVPARPTVPSTAQQQLRMDLIDEEAVTELGVAMFQEDVVKVADALGDSLVVIYGAANDWGVVCDGVQQDTWATRPTLSPPSHAVQTARLETIHHLAITRLQAAMDLNSPDHVARAVNEAVAAVYAAGDEWGIRLDPVLREIHRSNMSKLCRSEEEAQYAVTRYAAGEGYQGQVAPIPTAYRPCHDPQFAGCFVVYHADSGKTLKGPRYEVPQLETVLAQLHAQQTKDKE